MLHGFLFQPVNPANNSRTTKTLENQLNRNFKDFQGKRIRNIKITTLDPFGYSEKDSTKIPTRAIDKFGNALHGKTKQFTIKGLLVVKENQPLDSLLILESERLLRRRNFIRRALIRPQKVPGSPDEVDLHVYVLDSWSLAVGGDLSTNNGELELKELNFLGFGHQVTAAYKKGFQEENGIGYTMGYRAQNIYNSYINAEVSRDVEINQAYKNVFQVDRSFYSPFTRWAGKIGFTQRYDWEDLYMSNTDTMIYEPLKRFEVDVWGGYAIPIAHKEDEKSLPTNLILGARFAKRSFLQKPDETIDSVSFFANQNFFLGSVGLRHVNYVRDRYIFRNGDIEDIAVGSSYFINSGYQQNATSGNYYTGLSVTLSNYFSDFGYIAANAEYGSYYSDGDPRQSLFRLQTTYFTPVFSIGKWYFRQFAKLNSVVGINRKDIILDRIDLNGKNGITGFDSRQVFGTRKFVFSFRTQSYVPFDWIGFRMSPFLDIDLGCIGSEPHPFFKNEAYTKFGIGFLISNDYFVFENIKLSFFYIPKMPGNAGNQLQFQGSGYNQFSLEQYNYQPPHIIEYQ
ncbi:hypothetical protein SAMN05216480_102268 [Pustulibacterium marinum]|uniref:Outer membrane protein assembly factor BamA n=1 Tax=Pustulibacterium marinum TaxID=1224947 RepID=A0A1I7FVQ7_9FLAO|nr:hypothetical protein [Pustulibacterium marinum]SFU40116.1 hypothetical protein SAMN05216480_102268 [Pustulibacterium marinum]